MRNEMHEPGQKLQTGTASTPRRRNPGAAFSNGGALEPNAVDAAMAEELAPVVAQRGSRRDLGVASTAADKPKRSFDHPHALAPAASPIESSDGAILRSLTDQLNMLQTQQDQIRRLLEQAQRFAVPATPAAPH